MPPSAKTVCLIRFCNAGGYGVIAQHDQVTPMSLRPTEWSSRVKLQGNNLEPPMSALGHKQTSRRDRIMSALPPKADIRYSIDMSGALHATSELV